MNRLIKSNYVLLADQEGYRPEAKIGYVNIEWWHVRYNQKFQNLGDMLSEVVVDYMLDTNKIKDKYLGKTKHLYSIGSILFFEKQNATVWGTGSLHLMQGTLKNVINNRILRKLDIRMVRGPKTRDNLLRLGISCPEYYGDPAMLMPLIYKPSIERMNYVLVICHFRDSILNRPKMIMGNEIVYLSALTEDWKKSIDIIIGAKFVISSSLHGLIIAESYGVPAILLKPKTEEDLFKYDDYYWGTGRKTYPVVETIEEGICVDLSNYQFPDVKGIQGQLINRFPIDIWG